MARSAEDIQKEELLLKMSEEQIIELTNYYRNQQVTDSFDSPEEEPISVKTNSATMTEENVDEAFADLEW